MNKAFVLGAGLGNRLQKLTKELPKPLIPVFGKPLIEFAFEHLTRSGITQLIVNTHHCADAYSDHFLNGVYKETPITFRHESVLLDTGGGIDNVSDLLSPDPFLVYNGDILSDLPIKKLLEAHSKKGYLVTLALRSHGSGKHIALDANKEKVIDIRNLLKSGRHGSFQFTGIYACLPEFLSHLQHKEKHSVIPVFLKLIESGSLGGVIIDEGQWWDLGTRDAYLDAHLKISECTFPEYLDKDGSNWKENHSSGTHIASDVQIDNASHIGVGASIEKGAVIQNSIVWPYGEVTAGTKLRRCVVRRGEIASGDLDNVDI